MKACRELQQFENLMNTTFSIHITAVVGELYFSVPKKNISEHCGCKIVVLNIDVVATVWICQTFVIDSFFILFKQFRAKT